MREETGYDCPDLRWLTALADDPGHGWRPYQLNVFAALYDGVQPLTCREGQALAFIERGRASAHAMPDFVTRVWDQALAVLLPPVPNRSPCAMNQSPYAVPYSALADRAPRWQGRGRAGGQGRCPEPIRLSSRLTDTRLPELVPDNGLPHRRFLTPGPRGGIDAWAAAA
jgi:hypothetical protein